MKHITRIIVILILQSAYTATAQERNHIQKRIAFVAKSLSVSHDRAEVIVKMMDYNKEKLVQARNNDRLKLSDKIQLLEQLNLERSIHLSRLLTKNERAAFDQTFQNKVKLKSRVDSIRERNSYEKPLSGAVIIKREIITE